MEGIWHYCDMYKPLGKEEAHTHKAERRRNKDLFAIAAIQQQSKCLQVLFDIITVNLMALQSPTTLLNSIQYMKNQLRNDKLTLMDIKNDFTRFAKKPPHNLPTIEPEEESFVLKELPPHPQGENRMRNEKNQNEKGSHVQSDRGRVVELKREHQRELARLREQHAKEIEQLLRVKNLEIEDVQGRWRAKLEEQASYISLLEEQVSSPIQTQREKVPIEQYDAIINKLLQENTRLHESNSRLGEQCERLRRTCTQLDSERTNRSRFRFAKGSRQGKLSQYVSQASHSQVAQPALQHRRVSSVYLYNDQNVDRSNCNQWEDMEIQDDQGGLRTIRQFEKSVLEDNHCKVQGEGYLSLKL